MQSMCIFLKSYNSANSNGQTTSIVTIQSMQLSQTFVKLL